jgi:hypothetical protein
MNLKILGLAAVLTVAGGAAQAAAVTYDYTGTATGTLGGAPFNTSFDIFASGDTSGVQLLGPPSFKPGTYLNGTPFIGTGTALGLVTTTITLGGVGTFTVTDPSYVFNVTGTGIGTHIAGFGTSLHGDFADLISTALSFYNLKTKLGPLAVSAWTFGQTVATSGGVLKFTSMNARTFTATGPDAVPEPATWSMMLLGLGGLGAMLRARRRRTTAAG